MTVSINRLDLNLLRVFDAVMQERSVLRAGQRICLSQSAVSHALGRLREMLDDELFIRTASGMQPTARALGMAPLIRAAWTSLESAIGLPKFEPRSSTRRFTVAANDFVTTIMVPRLLDLLKCEAPHIDLVICPDGGTDLAEQIDLGQIDAAIGSFSDMPVRFRQGSLFSYDDVLITHASNKFGRLTPEKLSSLSIATIALHGEHQGRVDGVVHEHGLTRRSEMFDRAALEHACSGLNRSPRMAVTLPHFLALPSLLEASELTAIVPRPVARALAGVHPLTVHELPYGTARVDVSVLWHERNTADDPQQWFRGMLRRAAEPLGAQLLEFETSTRRLTPVTPYSRVAVGA
jgi:DNA-binding transcriptional LysR family regulator